MQMYRMFFFYLFAKKELLIYLVFHILCLQDDTTEALICCFLFPGAVLLVSVQGISVNVDPIFCTWLLYQPHRGSSRQQQQVLDLLSPSQSYLFTSLPLCHH